MKTKLNKFNDKKLNNSLNKIQGGIEKTEVSNDTTDWVRNGLGDREIVWVFGPDGWVRIVYN